MLPFGKAKHGSAHGKNPEGKGQVSEEAKHNFVSGLGWLIRVRSGSGGVGGPRYGDGRHFSHDSRMVGPALLDSTYRFW